MQYKIITDLEGPAGVERFSQTRWEPFYFAAKRLLTKEVNAAIAGILDVEPQAIIHVIDGHGSGGINEEDMDSRAVYIYPGGPVKTDPWPSYDANMYVGQHAMAGMANAALCHTGDSKRVVYKRLNGVYVGEFGSAVARAGYRGVPTIFLTGDDKAVAEACALIPGIFTVTTKWGEGWQKARHLSSQESCRQIRQVIAQACQQRHRISPPRFDPPYSYEIRTVDRAVLPKNLHPDVRATQLDAYTILYRSDDMSILPY